MNHTITRYADPQHLDAVIAQAIYDNIDDATLISGPVRCLPGTSHADRYGPNSRIAVLTFYDGSTLTYVAHSR